MGRDCNLAGSTHLNLGRLMFVYLLVQFILIGISPSKVKLI